MTEIIFSLDMDQNIICIVYETNGVAGQERSPGSHGNHPKSGNFFFKRYPITLHSPNNQLPHNHPPQKNSPLKMDYSQGF